MLESNPPTDTTNALDPANNDSWPGNFSNMKGAFQTPIVYIQYTQLNSFVILYVYYEILQKITE